MKTNDLLEMSELGSDGIAIWLQDLIENNSHPNLMIRRLSCFILLDIDFGYNNKNNRTFNITISERLSLGRD